MSEGNPHPNPTAGKSGASHEILESLTDEELETYAEHLIWEQRHRIFDSTNMYKSRGYYEYRSRNWISWIRDIQEERRK